MTAVKIASSSSQILQLPFFALLFPFLAFLFVLAKSCRKSKASSSDAKLPPGPPKLPLIGNLHQLLGPLPHHSITKLAKKHGPVMHLQLGEQPAVVVSSAEAAEEVLKTKEVNFAQRPQVLAAETMAFADPSSIFFAPYGDYWRQAKKICVLELLSVRRVRSFRSIREEEVWDVIASLSSRAGVPINVSDEVFSMVNSVVSRASFGMKYKERGEFRLILQQMTDLFGSFNLADLYPSLKFLRYVSWTCPAIGRIKKKLDKILDDIIHEHKLKRKSASSSSDDVSSHEDILDLLLKLQESNQLEILLTTDHIKAVTLELFFAGAGTSATAVEWAMSELLKNPDVLEKAQAEVREAFKGKTRIKEEDVQNLQYLKSVIKETFRLHPPGPLLVRECRENCEVSGYQIPAKTRVLINTWAISTDPSTWTEPHKFLPERFLDSTIDFKGGHIELTPFGAGRRICPGVSFAAAVIEFALAQMLYHFDWKLPDGMKPEELGMTEVFGMTSRKKHNLKVIATVHVPFSK